MVCKKDYDKGYSCSPYKDVIYERWYYDQYAKKCKEFYYYGCGGNKNNFKTKDLCEKKCSYYYNGEHVDAPDSYVTLCFVDNYDYSSYSSYSSSQTYGK